MATAAKEKTAKPEGAAVPANAEELADFLGDQKRVDAVFGKAADAQDRVDWLAAYIETFNTAAKISDQVTA